MKCTFRQSLGASLAGLALTYTVGRAVIYGLATSRLPFMRTPKMDERATLGMALGMARGEAVLTVLLWLAAVVLWITNGVIDPEARLWSVFMVVQSLPFAAAVAGVGGQCAGADAPRPRRLRARARAAERACPAAGAVENRALHC